MIASRPFRNRLIQHAGAEDGAVLAGQLTRVFLPRGFVIADPDEVCGWIYFPETAIISTIAATSEGAEVEVSLIGCEGVAPIIPILGGRSSPDRSIVQAAGDALKIPIAPFISSVSEAGRLRSLFARFVATVIVQARHTALANAVHPIDVRLARWLLMCDDRLSGDTVNLTHEYLALMLAVRRQSVTTVLNVLEDLKLITAERGAVRLLDRAGLESFAGDAYGRPEKFYSEIMGFDQRSRPEPFRTMPVKS